MYRQIADQLRREIRAGAYGQDEPLPSEAELSQRYSVSRMTARHAIDVLKSEGLVYSEHGRGVFVRPTIPVMTRVSGAWRGSGEYEGTTATFVEMESAGREPSVRYLQVGKTAAPEEVARQLEVRPGDPVAIRCRLMAADGIPLQIATSYVPWKIAKGTRLEDSDCEPEGSYPHIEASGRLIVTAEEILAARMPTKDEQDMLALPAGTPVLLMTRIVRDEDGAPLEVAETVNASDRYRFVYPYPYKGRQSKLLTLRR